MAKHKFGPGNCANPNGRPKMTDPHLSDFSKNLTKTAVMASLSQMLDASEEDIDAILKDRTKPALQKAVASVIKACIVNGDYLRLEMLLNRTIGKVKDESIIETKNHDEALDKVPREKIVALLRAANG
jgi:hypothetical protein